MSGLNKELVKDTQNVSQQQEENIRSITEETNRQVKNVTGTAEDLAGKGVRIVRNRKLKAGRIDLNGKIPHKEDGFLKTGKQGPRGRSANAGMLSGQGSRKPAGIRKDRRKIKDRLLVSGNTGKENIAIAGTAAKTTGRIAKASGKITAPKINVHPENNRVAAGTIKLSVEPAKKTIRTSAKLIRKAFEQEKNGTVDAAAFVNPAAPVTAPAAIIVKVIKKVAQTSVKVAKKTVDTAFRAGKKLGGAEEGNGSGKGKGVISIVIILALVFGLLFSCSSGTVTTKDHFKYSGRGFGSWPLPKEYDESYISSGFGYREFDHSFHNGVDFAVPEGTPVYAIRGGTVMQINRCDANTWPEDPSNTGNCVFIDHGDGLFSVYMHLQKINSKLEAGESVTKGMQIGNSGNTGASAGAHLHLGIRKGEKGCSWAEASYVDPMDYISLEGEDALTETEAHNMFVDMYYGDEEIPTLDDLLDIADERGINRECAYVIIGWCANEGYWAVPTLKGETSQYYFDYLCACCPVNYYFDEGIQTGTALAARVAGGDGSGTYAYNALKDKAEGINEGSRISAYLALVYTDTRVVGCHGMAVPPKESIIAVGRDWGGVKIYAASVSF